MKKMAQDAYDNEQKQQKSETGTPSSNSPATGKLAKLETIVEDDQDTNTGNSNTNNQVDPYCNSTSSALPDVEIARTSPPTTTISNASRSTAVNYEDFLWNIEPIMSNTVDTPVHSARVQPALWNNMFMSCHDDPAPEKSHLLLQINSFNLLQRGVQQQKKLSYITPVHNQWKENTLPPLLLQQGSTYPSKTKGSW